MTIRLRALLTVTMALAMMTLAACDHYNCSSAPMLSGGCTASSTGISSSGGGSSSGQSSIVTLAYYVNNNQIGSLELNSSAQLLDTPNFVLETLPDGYTNSAAVIAQEQFLYVPYASTSSAAAIYGWAIDGSTGALTALTPFTLTDVAGLPSASQPTTPVITDPTGSYLYMADATDSRIDVFTVDSSSGALTLLQSFSTAGVIQPWNLAMDGLGHYLYVTQGNASGEGQSMAVFPITAGALSAGTAQAFKMWQVQGELTGQFMIGVDGETGFASDRAFDPNVYVFSIGSNGVLTELTKYPTPSGNGPIGVAVSPNGQFVYDFNVSTSTAADGPLDGFSFTSGVLTPLPSVSGLTNPGGGFFDQSGAYLFFRASSAIGVFNIDTTTGTPSQPTADVGAGSGAVVYPWAITDPQ
ncbi:MAG: beta-propeller fold lactonase family protein [Candidatus Sulfotelmatobacter sp.]